MFLGASLAKSQGMQILMRMQNDMGKGSIPGNQIIHGLMVFAGGLLLLTPGFMTDIFGFSLVMPGPRHILIIWVRKLIENAMKSGNINFSKFSGPQGFAGGGFSTNSHQGFEQDTDSSTLFETGSFSEDSMSDKQQTAKKSSVIEGDIIEAEFTRKNDE